MHFINKLDTCCLLFIYQGKKNPNQNLKTNFRYLASRFTNSVRNIVLLCKLKTFSIHESPSSYPFSPQLHRKKCSKPVICTSCLHFHSVNSLLKTFHYKKALFKGFILPLYKSCDHFSILLFLSLSVAFHILFIIPPNPISLPASSCLTSNRK